MQNSDIAGNQLEVKGMVMKLERVEISHFRSILGSVSLYERGSKLFTLVGANGLGKSNILRAINLFFTGQVEPGQPFTPSVDLPQSNPRKEARIAVTFRFNTVEDKRMTTYIEQHHKGEFAEYVVPISLACYPNGTLQYSFTVSRGRNMALPELLSRVHEYVNCVYIPPIKDYRSILDSAMMRRIVAATFQGWGKGRYGSKTIGEQKEKFRNLLLEIQTVLDESGNYVSDILSSAVQSIKKFSFSLPYDNLEDFLGRLLFNFHERHLNDSISLPNVGSGVQSFTIYSMLGLLHEIRPTNTHRKSKFVWLIEEPETFMHHDLQRKLRKHFQHDAKDGHIIITTHSPVFIDKENFHNCYSVTRGQSTRVQPISSNNVRDVIGGNLGVAFDAFLPFKRTNILLEGKTDQHLLEQLNGLFAAAGQGDLLDLEETALLVCESANAIPHTYNLYNVFNRYADFIALFDRDPAGMKARMDMLNAKIDGDDLILVPQSAYRNDNEIEDLVDKKVWDSCIRKLDTEGLVTVETQKGTIVNYTFLREHRIDVKKRFVEYLLDEAKKDLVPFAVYKDLLKTLKQRISHKLAAKIPGLIRTRFYRRTGLHASGWRAIIFRYLYTLSARCFRNSSTSLR
jgi:putative ATP-dependent endonuclease of the OLD family